MPTKLPEKIFLQTFTYVPRIACNLLLENNNGDLLLTKRAIPPGINLWHYPGSFILKDEPITDCLKRIALNELGIELTGEPILAGVYENLTGDPRGHVIDILYKFSVSSSIKLSPTADTKDVRFFTNLPEDIGFGQKDILKKIGYS